MIYLVSSFHRSGSSMAMQALIAGGMAARWDGEQDQMNVTCGRPGYKPNAAGFFATRDDVFSRPDFTLDYDGWLVKCPYRLLRQLPRHDYRLLFMLRNPVEIRHSMATATPGQTWADNEALTHLYDMVSAALLSALLERGDMAVTTLRYGNVVAAPMDAFAILAACGWPIDATQAAGIVDAAQHRERA